MPAADKPAPPDKGSADAWTRGLGLLLLVAALAVFLTLAFDRPPPSATVQPWPDGVEYLDGAVHLARGDGYAIHLAGDRHPPRYPPATSGLITLVLVVGVDPILAPTRLAQLSALGLLALCVAALGRRRPVVAGLAALLLATLPAFVVLARAPMSAMPSALVTTLAAWLLWCFANGASWRTGLAGAFLLGLSTLFRTSNLFLFGLLPAAAWVRSGGSSLRSRADTLGRLGLAALGGWAPLLIFNTLTFGAPLAGGYGHWVPARTGSGALHPKYVLPNLEYYAHEFMQRERLATVADLFGAGSYVGPAFVVAVGLGAWALRRDRRTLPFALAAAAYGAALVLYFFRDARLAFPLLVFGAVVAAVGVGELIGRARRRSAGLGARGMAALALVATAAAIVGWPTGSGGSALVELDLPAHSARSIAAGELLGSYRRLQADGPRLVLTDLPQPLVHAVSPPGVAVAPLLAEHHYLHNPAVFRFGAAERQAAVERACADGLEVWALARRVPIRGLALVQPPPAGHGWEVMRRVGQGGVARLVPLGARPPGAPPPAAADQEAERVPAQSMPSSRRAASDIMLGFHCGSQTISTFAVWTPSTCATRSSTSPGSVPATGQAGEVSVMMTSTWWSS